MDSRAIFLLLAAVAACKTTRDPVRAPQASAAVMAQVDGVPILNEAFEEWLSDLYGAKQRQDYVSLWLLEREAKERGVRVSQEEIDTAREELWATWIATRLNGDAGALDAELARQGHDRRSYSRWFYWEKRRELLASQLIRADRAVTEAELRRRFEQVYGPGGIATQVRLLVLTRARLALELSRDANARTLSPAELDDRLMKKALELRARALAGESFEVLTRAESNDLAVRRDGGLCNDPQWRVRGAAFVRAAEQAPLGVVQPPVPNSSGIDLFEVISRKATRLDDVRAALTAELLAAPPSLEELSALDQRLRASAKIELY
jgi:parvulin-like peptidyl-prolyl isomerase